MTYDQARLDDVCMGNEVLRQRILSEFIRISPNHVSQLLDRIKAGDQPEIARLAHGLKGSSRAIGAIALGNLCEALESQSTSKTDAEMGAEIVSEFGRLLRALEAHMGTLN